MHAYLPSPTCCCGGRKWGRKKACLWSVRANRGQSVKQTKCKGPLHVLEQVLMRCPSLGHLTEQSKEIWRSTGLSGVSTCKIWLWIPRSRPASAQGCLCSSPVATTEGHHTKAARGGATLKKVGAGGEALCVDAQTKTVLLLQNTVQSL